MKIIIVCIMLCCLCGCNKVEIGDIYRLNTCDNPFQEKVIDMEVVDIKDGYVQYSFTEFEDGECYSMKEFWFKRTSNKITREK